MTVFTVEIGREEGKIFSKGLVALKEAICLIKEIDKVIVK
jgi:hypothetical protein